VRKWPFTIAPSLHYSNLNGILLVRLLKFVIGVLLVPVCVVLTRTVWQLLVAAHPSALALPPGALAGIGGFLAWIAIFFLLPRPVRSYVLAHELTHALWGMALGARVSRIRVGREAGSVELSKSNFMVALAPYFFPFYTVLTVAACGLAGLFADMDPWRLWWLAGVGLTWGFHFTFTITALTQRQTDVKAHGRLFSYTVIYALNLLGIGIWIVVLAVPDWREAATRLEANSRALAGYAAGHYRAVMQ